ncbi:hypothetical protein Tco_0840925 [Tanacetum coccineum]|uniref:Uncharacterized protein n=1 Tax=Tanacetum coccineum TaxID=301880 RepID=A0ABQ5AYH1_9ASTR
MVVIPSQCNRCGIGHIPSQCPNRDPSTIRTWPSANFSNTRTQSSNASANWHSDTRANSHVTPDLEAMDNSEAYYGDDALHVGNVEIIPTDLWHAPWLSDQLEWNLWHAPWLSDQLEWNLWPKYKFQLPGKVSSARGAKEEILWKVPRVIYTEYECNSRCIHVAPPSPDYIPDPEEPQTPLVPQEEDKHELMFIQAHDPDYVPKPMYPEYIPLEDEHMFPAEEQPLPPVDSPTAESPGYVAESDPEEDLEEYEDDETADGPVDYLMDGGDNGDNDYGDSSRDDADDEDEDEEGEEEHPALADSAVIVPTIEHVSPPKGTEPVIPPPSTDISTTGGRIIVRI